MQIGDSRDYSTYKERLEESVSPNASDHHDYEKMTKEHDDDDDTSQQDDKARSQQLKELYKNGGGPPALARAGEADRQRRVNDLLMATYASVPACTVATMPFQEEEDDDEEEEEQEGQQLEEKDISTTATIRNTGVHRPEKDAEEQDKDTENQDNPLLLEPYPLGTNAHLTEEELQILFSSLELNGNDTTNRSDDNVKHGIKDEMVNINVDEPSNNDLFPASLYDDDDFHNFTPEQQQLILMAMDRLDLDNDEAMMALIEALLAVEQEQPAPPLQCIPCDTKPKFFWDP